MKKQFIYLFIIALMINSKINAQDSVKIKHKTIIYTGFVNKVPDKFNVPLVGFVNIAEGSHESTQIGCVNLNQKNLKGAQVGFVNTCVDSLKGTQVGFVNSSTKVVDGVQVGYINTAVGKDKGAQIGYVNVCVDSLKGAQIGLINACKKTTTGIQGGYVNVCSDNVKGAQIGFVNVSSDTINGGQFGHVNVTKVLSGYQVGFVNYTDTIVKGMPIGFLSIVRRGGYRALDLGVTEMNPVNVSFKIGLKRLYSSFIVSSNSDIEKSLALGFGIGTIQPINSLMYFNPELSTQSTILEDTQKIVSLSTNVGFSVTKKLNIVAGPAIAWNNTSKSNEFSKSFLSVYSNDVDQYNRVVVGLRVSLRYNFGAGI